MKLCSCEIKNIRNIENSKILFSDGVNLIKGENAEGKTTVLEAVYVFARGRSFRTNKEAEFISFDKDSAFAEIEYEDSLRKNKMSVIYGKKEKRRMNKNGIDIKRATEFIGNFRAVLFTPDHLSLIKDSASERRAFADIALSQIERDYVLNLKKYNALLQNRNALLKQNDADKAMYKPLFETLAEQMAPVASRITEHRRRYCDMLDKYVSAYFEQMTDGCERVSMRYDCDVEDGCEDTVGEYFKKFTENIEREITFRSTLYGPQKDDIDIKLNGYSSRRYCSQGQQRSLAIAMKLAEGDISKDKTGEYPVYLLDDISGELDKKRRSFFLSRLTGRQIIITSCTPDEDGEYDSVITMKNGEAIL